MTTPTTFYYSDATFSTSYDSTITINSYQIPNNSNIISVDFGTSATIIDYSVFYDMPSLSTVNLSNTITSIGSSCFFNCTGLLSIDIPSSVTSIDYSCFFNCISLVSIKIPSSVTFIGSSCFSSCASLSSVEISSNSTYLDSYCFYDCPNLDTLTFYNSRNINYVGNNCFANTKSGIIVNYYNASSYDALSQSLQASQSQFTSPNFNYFSSLTTTGTTEYLINPTIINTSTSNQSFSYFINSLTNNIYQNSSGVQYGIIDNYTNALMTFSISAYDSNNNSITDFSLEPVYVSFNLSMADTSHILKLYKLDTGTTTLMNPQPQNFPITLNYSLNNQSWNCELPSLSDFIILDNSVCIVGYNKILMGDGTYKEIKNIKRGDIVITDIETKTTNKVAKLHCTGGITNCVIISKHLIGNSNEIIMSEFHPIWVNNDMNRIFAKDLKNVKFIKIYEPLYNIQFEDEGTYYVEGIKVDSLSPFHKKFPLEQSNYYNGNKYNPTCKIKNENDSKRNKPPMTKNIK